MPKVTLVEARELSNLLCEKMDYVRRLVDGSIRAEVQKSVEVETSETAPLQETEETKETVNYRKPSKSYEELMEELETLKVEHNKLLVAMMRFESTEQFSY